MNIVYEGTTPTTTANTLSPSELFQYNNEIYLMTTDGLKAVRLTDGSLVTFKEADSVTKITGTLSWTD